MSKALLGELVSRLPGGGGVCAERLLSEDGAWAQLRRQAKMRIAKNRADFESRLRALEPILKIEAWLPERTRAAFNFLNEIQLEELVEELVEELADRAVGAVFLAITVEFMVGNSIPWAHEIRKEATRWRFGAMLCAEARETPHRGKLDPDLAAALKLVGVYFDKWADFVSRPSGGVISRSRTSSGLGDDARRVQAQRIARTMVAIFGSPLAGTLAALLNAARALPEKERVTARDVETWCGGRLPT